jgi:hypothetical protein
VRHQITGSAYYGADRGPRIEEGARTHHARCHGGIVGGYLANVWYNGREVQLQMTTAPKS